MGRDDAQGVWGVVVTIEERIFDTLKGLVANRVYPDVAGPSVGSPYITYQQVGGSAINFLESGIVGKRNGRFQVNCWTNSRIAAAELSGLVEDAMVVSLEASVLGAPIATYDDDGVYGTHQDFSLWWSS